MANNVGLSRGNAESDEFLSRPHLATRELKAEHDWFATSNHRRFRQRLPNRHARWSLGRTLLSSRVCRPTKTLQRYRPTSQLSKPSLQSRFSISAKGHNHFGSVVSDSQDGMGGRRLP